jgi:hypothetical protein
VIAAERTYQFGADATISVSEDAHCHRESRHITAVFPTPGDAFRVRLEVCLPRSAGAAVLDMIAAALSTFDVGSVPTPPYVPGRYVYLSMDVEEDVVGDALLADRVRWVFEALARAGGVAPTRGEPGRFEIRVHDTGFAVHHTRGVRIELVRDDDGRPVDVVSGDSTVLAFAAVDSPDAADELMAEAVAADDGMAAERRALGVMRRHRGLDERPIRVLGSRDLCHGTALVGITADTCDDEIDARVRDLACRWEANDPSREHTLLVDVESVIAGLRAHRDLRASGTDRLITRTEAARRLTAARGWGRAARASDVADLVEMGELTGVRVGSRTMVIESEISALVRATNSATEGDWS